MTYTFQIMNGHLLRPFCSRIYSGVLLDQLHQLSTTTSTELHMLPHKRRTDLNKFKYGKHFENEIKFFLHVFAYVNDDLKFLLQKKLIQIKKNVKLN